MGLITRVAKQKKMALGYLWKLNPLIKTLPTAVTHNVLEWLIHQLEEEKILAMQYEPCLISVSLITGTRKSHWNGNDYDVGIAQIYVNK